MKRHLALAAVLSLAAASLSAQDAATPIGASPAPSAPQTRPKTYGTDATSYQHISAAAFTPAESTTTYSDSIFSTSAFGRYPTAGFGYFISAPTLPSGSIVDVVDFGWCDDNPGGVTYRVNSTNLVGTSVVQLALVNNSGFPGCGTTAVTLSSPFTIDNNANQLIFSVYIPVFDGSKTLTGATVHYKLQVSPAPGMATFNDVPASDFGFQYIEALAASGITGGCGGGNYCPDNPVTRRQMAIFLAKALGLQWP